MDIYINLFTGMVRMSLEDNDEVSIRLKYDSSQRTVTLIVEAEKMLDSNDFLTTVQAFITCAIEQDLDVFEDDIDSLSDVH